MPCVYRSQAQPPLWNSVTDACVGARCGTFVVFYIYLQKRWPFIADSLRKFSYPGHGFFVTLPWKTFFSCLLCLALWLFASKIHALPPVRL